MDRKKYGFRRTMGIGVVLAAGAALAACFQMPSFHSPEQPVYDVRSASVVSSTGASPTLLTAISERVNAAIAATSHSTTLPAVTLTIHVTQSEHAQGYQKDRNTAKVDMDASALDTGSVIAVSSFESTTFSADGTTIDDLMAEDIAARIRSSYSLTTPRLVN